MVKSFQPRSLSKQRVKTARKRSLSSTLWLQWHLNDPYVQASQQMGYRSRASFKLLELNDMYHFLHPGQRVVDLGCAPGGWSQVAYALVSANGKNGVLVGIDLLPVIPLTGCIFFEKDFLDVHSPQLIMDALGGSADVVLSDMAPNTIGHRSTDHLRMMVLCEATLEFACQILVPSGTLVIKTFQGGSSSALLASIKKRFTRVIYAKPSASRAGSVEIYVVALGFKG